MLLLKKLVDKVGLCIILNFLMNLGLTLYLRIKRLMGLLYFQMDLIIIVGPNFMTVHLFMMKRKSSP